MPTPRLTYLSPAWGLVPTPEQADAYRAIHTQVAFDDDSPASVEIVHNLALPFGDPLQAPQWVYPIVLVNAISGATPHTVEAKTGNAIQLGRAATGPGTAALYDVWIFGGLAGTVHPEHKGFFARFR